MSSNPRSKTPIRYDQPTAPTELELRRQAQIDADAELARRQSSIDQDEQERQLADKYDLVKMIEANPADFPIEVAMWGVLIEMVRPKSKFGGMIEKTAAQMQAE